MLRRLRIAAAKAFTLSEWQRKRLLVREAGLKLGRIQISWLTHDAAGFFTFLLVVVAVIQAALFVWQLILIRKTLAPAEEAARAATVSAKAVVDNERPWVGPHTVSSAGLAPGDKIQEACVVIKNTGNCPALRMRAAFEGSVRFKGAMPSTPDFAKAPPKPLFPNTLDFYYPFPKGFSLPDDDFRGIVQGRRIAWITGRIEYFDSSNKPHYTDVCCRWDQSRGVFVPHEYGNEAD